ncbi:S-Lap5 [Drosophila busckii]|uniref:Cytosol aminopeptidase n=1 Tax=Drosophila busckii TaxID=30019 RepID=A0A0M4EUC9_DROBS|nr:cytosol aminopeptidase [Drosophila busckii]ALC41007.1 S-Lap5 [Drosophila busckii]
MMSSNRLINALHKNLLVYRRVQRARSTTQLGGLGKGGQVLSETNLQLGCLVQSQRRGFASDKKCNEKSVIKGVVMGVYAKEGDKEPKLTSSGEKFDDRAQGKISELVRETGMNGELGKGRVFTNVDAEFSMVAVVGLGQEGAGFNDMEMIDEGMENARVAAGVGARALQLQGVTDVFVDSMEYPEQAAEGSALAIWRYNSNRRKQDRTHIPKLELYDSPDVDAWTRGLFKAESQNLARRMSDAPANQMTPTIFAQSTVDALCPCGVSVEIRSMDWIEENRLNSFLMVAKGSCEPPVVLEVNYCGSSPEDKPILLLGKGLTYNSGGLCLRPKDCLHMYRGCMAGAAVCVATIRAAAALSLPLNISAMLPLCENMPSGMAVKPGDVVTLLNGKTLGIVDVSKAGTVVMADPLLYAQTTFKPRMVIDVATIGYGVCCALGGAAAGIFSNSNYVYKQFEKAGGLTGDRLWRLPLWNYYKQLIKPNFNYDISNRGKGPASSCIAAAILHELVPCVDWAHLDIRNVGMLTRHNPLPYLLRDRMTGRPTRTLIQFLYQMACPDNK